MPISHQISSGSEIMYVTRTGRVSREEEEKAFRDRVSDPLFRQGIRVLVDCRQLELGPEDTSESIRNLAFKVSRLADKLSCGPVAIVVGESPLKFGMANVYTGYASSTHPNSAVFSDYDAAMNWLRQQKGSNN